MWKSFLAYFEYWEMKRERKAKTLGDEGKEDESS